MEALSSKNLSIVVECCAERLKEGQERTLAGMEWTLHETEEDAVSEQLSENRTESGCGRWEWGRLIKRAGRSARVVFLSSSLRKRPRKDPRGSQQGGHGKEKKGNQALPHQQVPNSPPGPTPGPSKIQTSLYLLQTDRATGAIPKPAKSKPPRTAPSPSTEAFPSAPKMTRLMVQSQLWEGVEKNDAKLVEGAILSDAYLHGVRADKGYRAPLHFASEKGHEAAVRKLLEAYATVGVVNGSGSTPLHLAAAEGQLSTVRLLVEGGADFNIKDNSGYTPLHLASRKGHDAVVKELLESGAIIEDVTSYGSTPLHLASRYGHDAMVRFLLEAGANVQAVKPDRITPLHLAVVGGHLSTVRLLVESGADPNTMDCSGYSPLHFASRAGHEAIVRELFKAGASTNYSSSGPTPLHLASENGHVSVVRMLLEAGAYVRALKEDNSTPLHLAAAGGHLSIVRLLVEVGKASTITLDTSMRSPVVVAQDNKHRSVVEYLRSVGSKW